MEWDHKKFHDLRIAENRDGKFTLAWNMDGLVIVTDFLVEFVRFGNDYLSKVIYD